ncbi:MAG: S1 RNA-binding domain-containing protein, partial [Betaproteobacteria bacterium]|nr:S1 RNA-binding domain-containing protein [Betaproteobacteria bacterium]
VESWLKCWYMRDKLGEEFIGSITAVTSFGIFVQLSALFVEGLIHISELGAEYFRFDEARNELRGERTGKRYALGDRVLVQVSRVDLDGRRIDFRMVSDPLRPAAAPGTRKRGRKAQAAAAAEDSDHSVFTLPPAQAPAAEPSAPAARKNRKAGKGAGDKAAAQTPADKPTDKAPKTPKAAKSPTRNARSTRARTPRQPATRSRRGGK